MMYTLDLMPQLAGLWRVFAAMALVLVAVLISRWQQIGLERDLLAVTVRSFVQLIAVGYALTFIFGQENPLWIVGILLIMLVIAAWTAGQRGTQIPHASLLALASISVGSGVTLVSLVLLRVFTFDAQTLIPIGGMIIGSAMATCALTMSRLADDLHGEQRRVQEALALGAPGRTAAQPLIHRAVRSAMIPVIDKTRVTGIIKLPGAMTGLILAGVPPLEAVQIQIIVMYMLVGAEGITGLVAAYLTYRQFFTPAHQLVFRKSDVHVHEA